MSALDYSTVPAAPAGLTPEQAEAHDDMRTYDGAWRAARAGGYSDETVRSLCSAYRDAFHRYQLLRWGKVRARVTVADLLR